MSVPAWLNRGVEIVTVPAPVAPVNPADAPVSAVVAETLRTGNPPPLIRIEQAPVYPRSPVGTPGHDRGRG